MSKREIRFIDRILTHPELEHTTNDFVNYYKIKEGYQLPVTAYKMVPNGRIGYKKYKVDCVLPENSVFWCDDTFCKEINSSAVPVIKGETYVGECFGKGCMNDNYKFENPTKTYEL